MKPDVDDSFSPRALRMFQHLFLDIDDDLGAQLQRPELWYRLDGHHPLFDEEAAARWIMESIDAGFDRITHAITRGPDGIVVDLIASQERASSASV
jgi:hypothetical protein